MIIYLLSLWSGKYEYFQTKIELKEVFIMKRLVVLVVLTACLSCTSHKAMSQDNSTVAFLALGDSYTIGEAVLESESWPHQLAKNLTKKGRSVQVKKVIATTGWTTDELLKAIEAQEEELLAAKFDLVSLLIGVNNQYRGYDIKQYKKEFKALLKKALSFVDMDPSKVFIVSIPDYSVTPFVADNNKDKEKIAADLIIYNQIAQEYAKKNGIPFYDITPISLKAMYEKGYVAADGLHPAAKMYQEWVDYFSSSVSRQITE
ncbi:MAG: lysophospholipase L1-like esterase [Marivirga sp.]